LVFGGGLAGRPALARGAASHRDGFHGGGRAPVAAGPAGRACMRREDGGWAGVAHAAVAPGAATALWGRRAVRASTGRQRIACGVASAPHAAAIGLSAASETRPRLFFSGSSGFPFPVPYASQWSTRPPYRQCAYDWMRKLVCRPPESRSQPMNPIRHVPFVVPLARLPRTIPRLARGSARWRTHNTTLPPSRPSCH